MPQGSIPGPASKYPPAQGDTRETNRGYRDNAAAEMFGDSGGRELTRASQSLHRALVKQAEKLEEFHSTPFTSRSAKTMLATIETIERVELQLERWHHLIYPNQKGN